MDPVAETGRFDFVGSGQLSRVEWRVVCLQSSEEPAEQLGHARNRLALRDGSHRDLASEFLFERCHHITPADWLWAAEDQYSALRLRVIESSDSANRSPSVIAV